MKADCKQKPLTTESKEVNLICLLSGQRLVAAEAQTLQVRKS